MMIPPRSKGRATTHARILWAIPCLALAVLLTAPAGVTRAATYEVAQHDPVATDDGPGTPEKPWKTLAQAARQAAPGDQVNIHDGIYREHVEFKTSGTAEQPIRFQAAPGAHVVLTGADPLTGWHRLDGPRNIYTIAWPHRFIGWNANMTHPDDEYHRLIGRCEQVTVDGYLLRQVLEAGHLAPGSFWVDVSNQVLQVWDVGNRDLNQTHVEGATRTEIALVTGSHVQLAGLYFRWAANLAQHGAVVLSGTNDLLEDCVVEDMNASGATLAGVDLVVRRCTFRDNGQLGFGANGAHRLRFTDCLVENNNTKGFSRGWEAGGNKLVLCRDAVLDHCRFLRNRGCGVWFDIGNENCTVQNCLVADNEDGGIFDEISFGLQAHDNVVTGNGFAESAGAWGAQAGITLSSSPESVIERNLLVGNREGFDFREQTRTTPRIGQREEVPVWNHDEIIRHNLIVLNRDAQVWGWFDRPDNRHWPDPKTAEHPQNLGDLHLQFIGNIYYADRGQGLIGWGPTWSRHRNYARLADFQTELGIDQGGAVWEPKFANVAARDFRLPSSSPGPFRVAQPQGSVPGCSLGWRE